MKNVVMFILVMFIAILSTGCHQVSVNAGEEAVLVEQPWFFGHGGVDKTPVLTGQTWVAWTTHSVVFKNTPVQYKETFDNMITDDNIPIDFDLYVEIQIEKGRSPDLIEKFGEKWYENNISPKLRAMTRDLVSAHKMFDIAGNREILTRIQNEIKQALRLLVVEIKLSATINSVTMGQATPPKNVLDETERTAAQTQSILTQEARTKAEMSRKNAETAKAIADNAYRSQMGMSTEQYLHLRQLEIEKEKVELISKKENVTIIFGNAPTTYPVK